MNNKNISPLYIYTQNAIATEVNALYLKAAYDAVSNAITNCCTPPKKVSKNSFLNTFYSLLNGMNKKNSLHKFEAVKDLLTTPLVCCGVTLN